MRLISQVAAVLLAGMTVVASTSSSALAIPAAASGQPAGCHGHKPPIPSPAPVNYQCCIAGHHQAVPSSLFSGLTPVACAEAGVVEQVHPISIVYTCYSILIPSMGPPGPKPLRI